MMLYDYLIKTKHAIKKEKKIPIFYKKKYKTSKISKIIMTINK